MWQIVKLDIPKGIARETTMKMTHEKVEIHRRYVLHKEMCIYGEIKMWHFGHSDSKFSTQTGFMYNTKKEQENPIYQF